MPDTKYAKIHTDHSRCLKCDSPLTLLYAIKNQIRHPQFFICWMCERIFEAGRGEVLKEKL